VILIIAEPADLGALWLRSQLACRLAGPVEVVTPAKLVYAPSILQRLTSRCSDGDLRLSDGRTLRMPAVQGMINRIRAVPTAHLHAADDAERDYAASELHAFLLGWLASFDCAMLNPPAPESLAGPSHSRLSALHFAAISGLGCRRTNITTMAPQPLEQAPTERIAVHFVLDGQVIGPLLPVAMRDAMVAFARLWGARLVQIETISDEGRNEFVRATSLVDFQAGGDTLVRAIARALSP
jgi:hypothetical protein